MDKPDLIIGIDFGMTCTGVSYANLSRSGQITWIYKWPGRSQASEHKVPTIIAYPKGSSSPSSWGFASETRTEQCSEDREYQDWFKRYLDPAYLRQAQRKDPENAPKTQDEVDKWFGDYMRLLYQHIEFKLAAELPSTKTWQSAKVEFIFSVPTTWAPYPTVEKFRSILEKAGYTTHPLHSVIIGLTEAEAAAVATSIGAPGLFEDNDVLMVCDAGGGTTDLSVLRVSNLKNGSMILKQLDVVMGKSIGSTAVDRSFEDLVLERLEAANKISSLGIDIDEAAWTMMKSKEYQNAKCDFGSPDDTPFFSVPVSSLSIKYNSPEFGIENGAMQFSKEDLQGFFEKLVKSLFEIIDEKIQKFDHKNRGQQISHLILSGGLGNSAYVQSRLKEKYAWGASSYSCAQNIQIHVAPDPQLAVCKGLVVDRKTKLESGQGILRWRCCRASYGTVAKIPYDKKNPDHFSKPTRKDSMDGKSYIHEGIVWFIKKGEPINVDEPVLHKFCRKLTPGDPRRVFNTSIVMSEVDSADLPIQITSGTANILCDVKADLTGLEDNKFKEKNRHWWTFRAAYLRIDFQIRVVIGPADIRFELWFDGQKLNKDNPIAVEWQDSSPPEEFEPIQEVEEESIYMTHEHKKSIINLRPLSKITSS